MALAARGSQRNIFGMTKRLIVALAALTGALLTAAQADPIATCAVPPVPPVGCTNQDAKCICDANGNCHWMYDCTQR